MFQKRKFVIYGILFLGISLIIGFILSMSFVWGMVFILFVLISVAFLRMKGGKKICQTNAK